jgi:membrane-bound serine protease (ClpP class)
MTPSRSFRLLRTTVSLALVVAGLGGYVLAEAGSAFGASERPVMIVELSGTVDDGMAHLVQRAVAEANDDGAQAIVFDVNSLGGLVEAALAIKAAIYSAHEPVYTFVSNRAASSAALISLTTSRILIAPGATIGPAEPHPDTRESVSFVRGEFESSVLRARHDPRLAHIAAAMVDRSIDLPDYKPAGQFLTLNTQDALKSGIASGTAVNLDDALRQFGVAGAPRVSQTYTWAEQLARFATDPAISGILLSIGMLGLILEMQTLHGIAGTIGVSALALFFGSHVYAGFSNGLVIALAILGLLGILWELHVVPGHGVPGILGVLALLLAVLLAFGIPFFFVAIETVSTSIVLTAIAFWFLTRYFPQNAWFAKLTLHAVQGADYVTSSDFSGFLGGIGTAHSFLRPAGIALIDGKRLNVLTEGEFIAAGTPVRVTRVEGARVFVEPVTLPPFN